MKTIIEPDFGTDDAARDDYRDQFAYLDWKADPESVLREVDSLLSAHGIEIGLLKESTGASDSYHFKIVSKD